MEDKYTESLQILKKCIPANWELCMWATAKFFSVMETQKILKTVRIPIFNASTYPI